MTGGRAADGTARGRLLLIRLLVLVTVVSGTIYIGWRWTDSISWSAWWIAVP